MQTDLNSLSRPKISNFDDEGLNSVDNFEETKKKIFKKLNNNKSNSSNSSNSNSCKDNKFINKFDLEKIKDKANLLQQRYSIIGRLSNTNEFKIDDPKNIYSRASYITTTDNMFKTIHDNGNSSNKVHNYRNKTSSRNTDSSSYKLNSSVDVSSNRIIAYLKGEMKAPMTSKNLKHIKSNSISIDKNFNN